MLMINSPLMLSRNSVRFIVFTLSTYHHTQPCSQQGRRQHPGEGIHDQEHQPGTQPPITIHHRPHSGPLQRKGYQDVMENINSHAAPVERVKPPKMQGGRWQLGEIAKATDQEHTHEEILYGIDDKARYRWQDVGCEQKKNHKQDQRGRQRVTQFLKTCGQ